MPILIKWTMSFAGQDQGWSESYYYSPPSTDLTLAQAFVDVGARKRAAFLAFGYTLTQNRVVLVQDAQGNPTKRISRLAEPRYTGVDSWGPAPPNVSLMTEFFTGDGKYTKKVYLRGLPGGLGDLGKKPDLNFGTFASKFNDWSGWMINSGIGWMVSIDGPKIAVTSYTANPATGIVSLTLAAPGITAPVPPGFQFPAWLKFAGKSPLDGRHMLIETDATHLYTAQPIGVGPYPGQGQINLKAYQLVTLAPVSQSSPIGVILPQRMVTHKTGRPFYASRGRRSAVPRW